MSKQPAVNPRSFVQQVTIQSPASAVTGGETVTTWSDVRTVYCSLEPIAGREYFLAAQIQSDITHRLRGWWDDWSDVTAAYRVTLGSRIFELLEPPRNLGEENRQVECLCREVS